ncbi:asparagine synthase (glutamine-hydrolyzing) [Ruminiclostridium josui]|uniref:asparagine synthase (glutamine-hydrolyzing) n=1 Tax=Ruminiclostridium josui TaxID=1499 RepID=UPI0009EA3552|nr:asparagine synthase (glutamine-hydrolyzing) [Ruminiclostridium josui]
MWYCGSCFVRNSIPDRLIEKMTGAIVHRGPDGEGYYYSSMVQLGARRLSIVDTKNGGQPMFNENKSIVAVFNGEIYNYIELMNQLISKGHAFNTLCDAEVIVHLYEEYGVEMLEKIDGQFSFAVYDQYGSRVFIARDRNGICPLFYSVVNNTVYFGSEIKAIAQVDEVEIRPSMQGLYEQFVYWSPAERRTVFENIYQIPSSGYAIIDKKNGLQVKLYHRFSDYAQEFDYSSINELKNEIRTTLKKAILERLMCDSDVKWGIYLSGGLDSTILIKLLYECGYDEIPTFSLGFKDYRIDESAYQALGLEGNKGQHTKITVSDEDIISQLSKVIKHCEVPLYKLGAVPMYMLSKAAHKNGVKFVLSGEGADELFYGYDIYKETLYRKYCSLNPASNIRTDGIKNFIPSGNMISSYVLEGYKKYYSTFFQGSNEFIYSMQSRITASSSILEYFNQENKACIDLKKISDEVFKQFSLESKELTVLKKCQAVQMQLLLSGYLLSTQGDRVLMANSVEGRYPFLDRRLIRLAYSIPDNLKLAGYNEKYILKETFSDIVPEPIIKRAKYQYSTPGVELFLKNINQFETYLTKNTFDKYGVFDYGKVHKLIKELKENSDNFQRNITQDMTMIYVITTHMLFESAYGKFV